MKTLKSESGLATLESLPLMVIFLLLIGYSFGVYGIIQSAMLNSIGARTYAFETFRNRTNVTYFRTNAVVGKDQTVYNRVGNRFHVIVGEGEPQTSSDQFPATARPLAKGINSVDVETNKQASFHNNRLPAMYSSQRYEQGVAPVWIRVGYGICLNSKCEP